MKKNINKIKDNKIINLNYTIGRFNPLHLGHVSMINPMVRDGDFSLIFIGSANVSRTDKNPFTYAERAHLLTHLYPNTIVLPLNDYKNMDTWTKQVENKIQDVKEILNIQDKNVQVNLYTGGDNKGNDAELRQMWCSPLGHNVVPVHLDSDLSATLIRDYFYLEDMKPIQNMLPENVFFFLENFRKHKDFSLLKRA